MEDEMAEVNAIVNNSEEPTFDNTITAMQFTCELISTVQRAMKPVSGVSRDFGRSTRCRCLQGSRTRLRSPAGNRGLISR